MDENRIEGAARNVAGKAQEAYGNVTGDAEHQGKGRAKQVVGQAQNMYGNTVDTVRNYAEDQPLVALLIAGGIGMVLGMLMRRH